MILSLGKGAIVIANDSEKVNRTVTRTCTGHKTGVILGTHGPVTRRGITRLRSCNMAMGALLKSIDSFRATGRVIDRAGRLFNSISILIGGTKVAHSGLVVHVSRRSFSTACRIGLGNAFGVVHRTLPLVLGRETNDVVGVSDMINRAKGAKRTGCTTDGTNVVKLAGSITHRTTAENVAYGTVTPKFVRARVASILSRGVRRRVLARVPLGQFKGTRRITGATIFLDRGACVANRAVDIGNNVCVWSEEVGVGHIIVANVNTVAPLKGAISRC